MDLNTKIDRLIAFLKICPKCVSGNVQFTKNHLMSCPAVNTRDQYLVVCCQNEMCDYTSKILNKDYKDPNVLPTFSENNKVDEFYDLFG
jgi:hypothetical protein